jgi:redox-sensitive bicupin YhaK (pirin superfamily)
MTIVYDGEVAHRDSNGAGGTIGPGDVQWMTAASGIMHDEILFAAFTKPGGLLEMVQLRVHLHFTAVYAGSTAVETGVGDPNNSSHSAVTNDNLRQTARQKMTDFAVRHPSRGSIQDSGNSTPNRKT